MASYRNISMDFWTDSKVVDDFTPEDRYIYLYCMTNPHTNLCGCYEVSIKQIANETGYNNDIRPCCPARPLIESFAAHASTLCRTSARRHASHSLPPSSMRQFSGAATIAHAVSGVVLSIMSSKASCIPQASQI